MTKSKSSASSTIVRSIFVEHLANGAKYLNDTCTAGNAVTVLSPFTKI